MKKVRLIDIAESLGVSASTVSRALNGNPRISEDIRNAVIEKSREMNYDQRRILKARNKPKTVNIVVLSPYNMFFKTVIEGMKSAQVEYDADNINVDYKFFGVYDVVEQTKQLREIINDNQYDGIIIAPAHPIMLDPLLNELVEKGKTVITFNTDAPDSGREHYIGQHSLTAGYIMAQLCGIQLKENEDIAVINSFALTLSQKERTDGFIEYIGLNYPHLNILGPFEFTDTIETAENLAEQIIEINKNIKAIYSNSMVGTIGCARAVEKTGKNGDIFVVGFDNNEEIDQYISKGIVFSTVLQQPFNQGYQAMNILIRKLAYGINTGQTNIYMKCDLLMKSTLNLLSNKNKENDLVL